MNYATLFYNVLMNPSAATQSVLNSSTTSISATNATTAGTDANIAALNANNQLALMPLKRLLNDGVLIRIVQSVQLKFLNFFLLAVV